MASFTNEETEAHGGEKLSQGPQCTGPGAQMGAQGTRPGPSTEQLLRWQLSGGLSWGPETLGSGDPAERGLSISAGPAPPSLGSGPATGHRCVSGRGTSRRCPLTGVLTGRSWDCKSTRG